MKIEWYQTVLELYCVECKTVHDRTKNGLMTKEMVELMRGVTFMANIIIRGGLKCKKCQGNVHQRLIIQGEENSN